MNQGLAEFVRRHDPDRFLCALLAPAAARPVLMRLAAFNHELARAREVAREPMVALMRLQWWREVVEGAHRQHEVATPLTEALDSGALDRSDLLGVIEAREIETDPAIPTLADWLAMLRAGPGGLAAAAGRALGADEPTRARLRAAGAAYGAAGLLRSVGIHATQGRVLLPQDMLESHGIDPAELLAGPGAALAPVADALAGAARELLDEAGRDIPKPVIAAGLPAVLARRDLARGARRWPEIWSLHPQPRGVGDRLAVVAAAWRGRLR